MKYFKAILGMIGVASAAGQDFSLDALKETFTPTMKLEDFTPNLEFDSMTDLTKYHEKLSAEFLTGFQAGMFLTHDKTRFDEYECPEEKVEPKSISKASQTVIGMLKNVAKSFGL